MSVKTQSLPDRPWLLSSSNILRDSSAHSWAFCLNSSKLRLALKSRNLRNWKIQLLHLDVGHIRVRIDTHNSTDFCMKVDNFVEENNNNWRTQDQPIWAHIWAQDWARTTVGGTVHMMTTTTIWLPHISMGGEKLKVCIFEMLNNLTHALAVNVDRVSPGPFFSGL